MTRARPTNPPPKLMLCRVFSLTMVSTRVRILTVECEVEWELVTMTDRSGILWSEFTSPRKEKRKERRRRRRSIKKTRIQREDASEWVRTFLTRHYHCQLLCMRERFNQFSLFLCILSTGNFSVATASNFFLSLLFDIFFFSSYTSGSRSLGFFFSFFFSHLVVACLLAPDVGSFLLPSELKYFFDVCEQMKRRKRREIGRETQKEERERKRGKVTDEVTCLE